MSNESDSFMRELEEEVRRAKLAKLWNAYGLYVIGAVVVMLGGIIGWQQWTASQLRASEAAGARFIAAVTQAGSGKADEAAKSLREITTSGPQAYATLARLRLAADALKAGNTDEASKTFDAVIADPNADELLKNFARLQSASLKLGTSGWTEAKNQLNDLAKDSSPWKYSARELIGLGAYKAGDMAAARQAFEPLLADVSAPSSLRARAEMLMSVITAAEMTGGTAASTQPAATPKQ